MKQLSITRINQIHLALIIAGSLPFLSLLLAYVTDSFGPDPVSEITHATGTWALRLLLLTLAVSPLRKFTGWQWLMRLRRTLALYSFAYVTLHFLSYVIFDHSFDLEEMFEDAAKHPYLIAGLISYALMIPLALTSTTSMMKRLGGRNWKNLHRLTYLIAFVGVLHYFLLVKRDINYPSSYALILAALFCARMAQSRRIKPEANVIGTTLVASHPSDPWSPTGRSSKKKEFAAAGLSLRTSRKRSAQVRS